MSQLGVVELLWLLAAGCVILTLYPYALYPLILRLLPARPVKSSSDGLSDGADFALLFCAYNEAKSIPDKVANLKMLRATYPRLEILMYDDASTDGTADLLRHSGVDVRIFAGSTRRGKAHGMKLLAAATDRNFLIFTDANVELDVDVVNQLYNAYSDREVGGICGLLKYGEEEGTAATYAGGLYWRIEEMIKSLESRSGNVMGADGSIFSIRRSLYPDFPDTVLDDMTVSMGVVFRGFRLIKDPQVIAYERLVASSRDDYRRRLRIATRVYHTHMIAIKPMLSNLSLGDRWRWWSHRWLKWHGAAFVIGGYVSALLAIGLSAGWELVFVAGAAPLAIAGFGLFARLGPLSAVSHILSSILLSGLGVIRARRGRTVTVWTPPATR